MRTSNRIEVGHRILEEAELLPYIKSFISSEELKNIAASKRTDTVILHGSVIYCHPDFTEADRVTALDNKKMGTEEVTPIWDKAREITSNLRAKVADDPAKFACIVEYLDSLLEENGYSFVTAINIYARKEDASEQNLQHFIDVTMESVVTEVLSKFDPNFNLFSTLNTACFHELSLKYEDLLFAAYTIVDAIPRIKDKLDDLLADAKSECEKLQVGPFWEKLKNLNEAGAASPVFIKYAKEKFDSCDDATKQNFDIKKQYYSFLIQASKDYSYADDPLGKALRGQ